MHYEESRAVGDLENQRRQIVKFGEPRLQKRFMEPDVPASAASFVSLDHFPLLQIKRTCTLFFCLNNMHT